MTKSQRQNHFRRNDLAHIRDQVNRIEAALTVREPGSSISAEAFEGLRRQVVAGAAERRRLLVCLADLRSAIDQGATLEALTMTLDSWCDQAGLTSSPDFRNLDHYERLPASDDSVHIHRRAWVDQATGAVIRRGLAVPPPSEVDERHGRESPTESERLESELSSETQEQP